MSEKCAGKEMNDMSPSNPLVNLTPNDHVGMPRTTLNIFTNEECDCIISLSDAMPLVDGHVGFNSNAKHDTTIRDSSLKWLMPGPSSTWVFERIRDAGNEANKFYKYDLHGFHGIQIARYGVGGHYTWHSDLGMGETSLRKLSISVQLSAPEDYDGGELEFQTLRDERLQPSKERGSVIFFPPFMAHRVAPVIRGVRWSLVTWIYGPPFR